MKEIDAKGLACPKPVVLAKKAINSNQEVLVIVDNQTAANNLKKLAKKMGAEVSVVEESETEFKVMFKKLKTTNQADSEVNSKPSAKTFLIAADKMGTGEAELGKILIKGFISTIKELEPLPQKIIFINSGVKLAVNEEIIPYLKELIQKEVEILLCGTCVDYYGLQAEIELGEISNMYEIASALNTDQVVRI
ncbi:sulfurtransferase-like selenium metabolism protein YedF [Halanaerobium praevalens]|uniref:Selenium metabolism protein YedF n=1 Tax=Halanaerobium praevalens (strain ATCC 33744 / DSM 2228 / GSL) TaxID=572479 RepID=E3DM96_HALPG|nr:sulfurtransferase-like selenium metabolism protein YedF [Halanaerobium praevalens]ADO76289.1 selenium metabolism protein YedF [Halanaerobium praevalens DSM 2228]